MIKHHNSLFQQPHLQQALDVPNRRLCKDVGLCRIPICKFYDLRCAILKIKPQLTPFAVVVCLIQVGSERRFVENEVGQRFYFDFYGAKWLAFANGPGNI